MFLAVYIYSLKPSTNENYLNYQVYWMILHDGRLRTVVHPNVVLFPKGKLVCALKQ